MDSDGLTISIGTLGGFLSTYDLRYSVVSSLYLNELNYPVLALATYKKKMSGENIGLVSLGGKENEIQRFNFDSGKVEPPYFLS